MSGDGHALRYRCVDTGTLYDCECGDFTDAADPTDEDHRRVYREHGQHIAACHEQRAIHVEMGDE